LFICNSDYDRATTWCGKIIIVVTAENKNALENATVELLNAKDSSLVKADITDDKGIADFQKIAFGAYLAKVTLMNYDTKYSNIIELTSSQTTNETKLTLQQHSHATRWCDSNR
jgi:hypothetical protein